MGQEIVHCSACGVRLRSVDFEKGEALRVDYTAYCLKCAPQGAKPDPLTASSSRRKLGSTNSIPVITPRRGMEAVPAQKLSPALLWGGGALLVALLAAVLVATSGRSAPPPTIVDRREPPPAPPKPVVAKDPAPVPAPAPAPAPKQAPAVSEAAELATIDRKTADLSAQERFGEALEALTAARSRHDSLEWTAAVQSRTRDLDGVVKKIYADLQIKVDQARQSGADAEVKTHQDRIAKWNMPGYGPIPEKPAAAAPAPPPEPAPAPAPPPPAAVAPAPAPVAAPDKPGSIPFVPGAMKWSLLAPMKATASDGVSLTLQEDGSVLAGGPNPAKARYAVVVQTELKSIQSFRLEMLPDPSLPRSGPGRAFNGNLVVSEFKVQVLANPNADSGTPVVLEKATASYAQEGFPPAHAIDGRSDTGWALMPASGRASEASFEVKAPVASAGPLTLLIVLDHQSIYDQHLTGRFRISVSTSRIMDYPAPPIDPARVDKAIQQGIAWLRNAGYPADYWMSANELILWTFVHAGVPESDPDFQKRLKQMLDAPLERTYRVALQAMILEELDRVAYQYRIWQCAQFLVDNQCPNGQWLYGTPTEFPKGVPTPAKPPVPTSAKLDAEGRRVKPKVIRKLKAQKTRDGPAEGDNSNSQYAALGLRACYDAGVLVPEDTVLRAVKYWRETQHFDEGNGGEYAAKGWSYVGPAKDPKPSHAMTAGGISSLAIYDYILNREWKKSTPIKAGINWIARSWTVNQNFYYLYGMERAAVLCGLEKYGRHSWYALGAQYILDSQDPSGAWMVNRQEKGDDVTAWNTFDTCFAILFLKRATRPLVASEDRK
jgi:hypothetical protein